MHWFNTDNERIFYYYRDHNLLIKGEVVMRLPRNLSRKNQWMKTQHPMNCF